MSRAHRSAGEIVGGATGRTKTTVTLPFVGTEVEPSRAAAGDGVTRTLEPTAIGSVGVEPHHSFDVVDEVPLGWYSTEIATERPVLSRTLTCTWFSGALEVCTGPGAVTTGL